MSKQKQPRVNKTKDEVVDMMAAKKEAERKRDLIRDGLWPILVKSDEEIRYIKVLLQTVFLAVEQAFGNLKKTTTVKDLDLLGKINKDIESYETYKAVFELLENETVESFGTLLRDLPDYIEGYINNTYGKQKFSELNVDEILG